MMLNIKALHFSYGNTEVLSNVNWKIEKGFHGLVGKNGAGKTSLLNVLAGVNSVSEGSVLYNHELISSNLSSYLERVGYLPQKFNFYNDIAVQDILLHLCHLRGIKRKEAKQKVKRLLEITNLTEQSSKKYANLSGGMKQRVGIAQSLIGDPEVLIVDEPSVGLDPIERKDLFTFLKDYSRNNIVIISSHILRDLQEHCDSIALLHNGFVQVFEVDDQEAINTVLTK